MKLLLLLIMIYGVEDTLSSHQQSVSTTQKKNKSYSQSPKTTPAHAGCDTGSYDVCSSVKKSNSEKEKCRRQQNKEETECIHSIMNTTKESQTFIFTHFALTVVQINKTFGHLQITAPSVSNKTRTIKTWIPMDALRNVPGNQQKVGVVTYDSDEQFNQDNAIMSKVIRIEVLGTDIVNLTNPLIIHFPVNNYTNHTSGNYIYSCQYYDEKGNSTWKTDGCNTTQLSDDVVECSCNHMTPFAVLLVELNNIDERQWEILSYISYIGCGLSAIFSAFAVLWFMFNRNARAEVSSSLHVSLSGALFLLNISFMLSEWAATLGMEEFCVFIAVMIHYSLLCCFTWMAVEALHLYLLLIRVFNIYFRHYMIKLSLIGWGIPAAVVGSLLTIQITHPLYGTRNVTLSNSNATNAVCWIKEPLVLYGVNLSYFTVTFLFNLLVLLKVSRQIFKLKQVEKKKHKIPVKDAGTVLGLMCLLGITWGLVFLGSGYTNYIILYMFCISNTLQGASIFLWMCLTMRPNKQKAALTKSLSTVDTTKKQKE
ncbi:adhesion G-protein coupled receptor G2-like [Siphateles boraxobius]|uniref:adhesion G-protein coupled receptor G2-like n=1 Tax=Siphateles boraxobius TaxID=180520 RepID=UPI004062A3A9